MKGFLGTMLGKAIAVLAAVVVFGGVGVALMLGGNDSEKETQGGEGEGLVVIEEGEETDEDVIDATDWEDLTGETTNKSDGKRDTDNDGTPDKKDDDDDNDGVTDAKDDDDDNDGTLDKEDSDHPSNTDKDEDNKDEDNKNEDNKDEDNKDEDNKDEGNKDEDNKDEDNKDEDNKDEDKNDDEVKDPSGESWGPFF